MNKILALLSGSLLALLAGQAGAADKVDFAKQIRPIFAETCYKCHGAEKQKGDLRMDTAEAFAKGGETGPSFVVGDPAKSDLHRRVTLPADHDDIMPPKGDPLKKEQTDLIAQWITEGASFGDWKADAPAPGTAEGPKPIELPVVPAADAAAVEKIRGAGALAMPLAQGINLLDIGFTSGADKVSDAQVALLAPVAPQVAELNLANTKITDAGLAPLAGLTNLRVLHLEKTPVTDAGLAHLKGLASLEYLNLYGTGVTDAGLAQLEGLKSLKKLYLWQTKVTAEGATALKAKLPAVVIDRGWEANPPAQAVAAATPAPAPAPAPAPVPPPTPAAKPINLKCPVSGKDVNAQFTLAHEGKTVGFCCDKCPAEFQKEPAKYAVNIKADAPQ